MVVLGLNAYHGDAAACLLRDGRIVAAAEEERFGRIKHWAGFPRRAIDYCLDEAGITIEDVDHVAVNGDPKSNLGSRVAYALRRRPSPKLLIDRLLNQRRRHAIEDEFQSAFPGRRFRGVIHRVEHHLAHLASAYLVSPFSEAVVASIDGFGDFASAAWGVAAGDLMRVDGRVLFPHSLGLFYQAITQYLGFPNYGDEYKVMGLAPYGSPNFRNEMGQILRRSEDGAFALDLRFFRHHREKIAYQWSDGAPSVGTLFSEALVELLGPPRDPADPLDERFLDVARSAQDAYEGALMHLLCWLHARYGVDNLALAGGCAMNSVANGKITDRTPFRRVYVPAAAGDAGGAIGAALYVSKHLDGRAGRSACDGAYLGPRATPAVIAEVLSAHGDALKQANCAIIDCSSEAELCERIASAIASGKVVGWFQGRMEWGPRALGNRSILADPRRADMREILNVKIKKRESFRPFAPSILAERAAEWFEHDDDVPFMSQVFQIREEKRALIPAVTHVDGSGRLQTVKQSANPRFYALISAFDALSGVPMLLNTSFNESEPIVCRPEEALGCFLRTNMDVLALGETIVLRNGKSA